MAVYDKKTKVQSEKGDKEKVINITLSVFFDGTSNNMHNTEAFFENERKKEIYKTNSIFDPENPPWDKRLVAFYNKYTDHTDSSFENDYTNVVKIYKNYKKDLGNEEHKQSCIYVDGIATGLNFDPKKEYKNWEDMTQQERDLEYTDDSTFGAGFGILGTGIYSKVKQGCKRAATEIANLNKGKRKLVTLTIDVFGFSRGAAAARTFIHEITKPAVLAYSHSVSTGYGFPVMSYVPAVPAHGLLGEALAEKGITFERLKIRFAGLFDTVSSHGLFKSDDVSDLQLQAVSKARFMLHLTAADEKRYFFPLVTAAHDGKNKVEKELPGVHSDIGGSYVHNAKEVKGALAVGLMNELSKTRHKLVRDGWYRQDELTLKDTMSKVIEAVLPNASLFYDFFKPTSAIPYLQGKRDKVSNEYSFIALHFMSEFASKEPVYVRIDFDAIIDEFSIPVELDSIRARLYSYVFDKTNTQKKMQFFSREELNFEIASSEKLASTVGSRYDEKEFVNVYQERMKPIPVSTSIVIEKDMLALNSAEFQNNPELKRKIEDHNTLLKIRHGFFHQSADWTKIGMNPTISGIRMTYEG